ncbi:MAG TPA: hypothetical protein VLE70_20505 [Anaerolineae bacterium]|nr:hypothetical protein [Anaerolineae bacterium]
MDNEIVVMSVSRVPPMGKLVVGAVGGRYESIDDVTDDAARRMINAAIAELVVFAGGYESLVRAGLAPPVAAGPGPAGSELPTTLEERQAAFEQAVEQQQVALLVETAAPEALAAEPEPLSIPDQINPLIQKHLAADPALAGHMVKLEQDTSGNLNIIADGRIYERPDMIEDVAIRKAIRAALSEWDRT